MSVRENEYLYVLLRRAARELERLEALRLSRTRAKLRPAYVPALAALLEASPLTVGDLVARCEVEPSTMTGVLRALEEQGLVTREKVVLDQRSRVLALTARGRVAARVAVDARTWAQTAVLAALGRDSGEQLGQALAELAAAADVARVKAEERAKTKPPRRAAR